MFSSKFKNQLSEGRMIFQHMEKPGSTVSDSDKKKGKEILDEAAKKARLKDKAGAIEVGKSKAVQEQAPGDKPKVPEIPKKLSGLKFDAKDAKFDAANGTVEQPFQFGDLKIKGKIVMPDKPDSTKKTTYIFNYVDDPAKFDQTKFLAKLKEKKEDLGNTVIITLRTPEGETKIDKQKVDTMEKLLSDVEKFQADLPGSNPKFAALKMMRAENILHMTDSKNIQRVGALVQKFAEKSSANDARLTKFNGALNADSAETFSETLDSLLAPPKAKDSATDSDNVPVADVAKKGSGGGMGGGSGMGSAGGSGGGSSAPSESPASDSPASSDVPTDASESKEKSSGLNKLLILGDSLMVGAQDKVKANYIEKDTKVGRTIYEVVARLKKMDASGGLEKFRNESIVVDGGTNDLGGLKTESGGNVTKEQILGHMQEMWAIGKKYNIKIFQCALAPFGENKYPSLTNGYVEKNAARIWLNEQLRANKGDNGPFDVIPLDLPASQGGVADENNPDKLAPEYGGGGDGIHLNGKGYQKMAEAIQKITGEPIAADGVVAPGESSAKPEQKVATEEKSQASGDKPKGQLKPYTAGNEDYNIWASSINQQFIDSGAPFGSYKVVEYKGKKLIAKHTEHTLQAATGKTGKFKATETYEYNPDFDPAQKKSLNA